MALSMYSKKEGNTCSIVGALDNILFVIPVISLINSSISYPGLTNV